MGPHTEDDDEVHDILSGDTQMRQLTYLCTKQPFHDTSEYLIVAQLKADAHCAIVERAREVREGVRSSHAIGSSTFERRRETAQDQDQDPPATAALCSRQALLLFVFSCMHWAQLNFGFAMGRTLLINYAERLWLVANESAVSGKRSL